MKSLVYTVLGTFIGVIVGLIISIPISRSMLGSIGNIVFFMCVIGGALLGMELAKRKPFSNIGRSKSSSMNYGSTSESSEDFSKRLAKERQKDEDYWNDLNYDVLKSKSKHGPEPLRDYEISELKRLEQEQINRMSRND